MLMFWLEFVPYKRWTEQYPLLVPLAATIALVTVLMAGSPSRPFAGSVASVAQVATAMAGAVAKPEIKIVSKSIPVATRRWRSRPRIDIASSHVRSCAFVAHDHARTLSLNK